MPLTFTEFTFIEFNLHLQVFETGKHFSNFKILIIMVESAKINALAKFLYHEV